LPQLSLEELQAVTERIYELKIEAARGMAARSPSKKQNAKVEALLEKAKRFRDSLNFTTTPQESDRFKREGRL
jgi:hypothetical protein